MDSILNEGINNVSNIRVWVENKEDVLKFEDDLHSIYGYNWIFDQKYLIRDNVIFNSSKTFIFYLKNNFFDCYTGFVERSYEGETDIKILDYSTEYYTIDKFLKHGKIIPIYKPKNIIKESIINKYEDFIIGVNNEEDFFYISKKLEELGLYHLKYNFNIIYPNFIYINTYYNNFGIWDKKSDKDHVESFLNDIKSAYKKIFDPKELNILIQIIKNGDVVSPNYFPRNIIKESNVFYPYRFKTEKEFIKEYGQQWRGIVIGKWVSEMDHLLGKDYPYTKKEIDLLGEFYNNSEYFMGVDGWAISKNMITLNKPNYKPKNIIKESLSLKYGEFVIRVNNEEEYLKISEKLSEEFNFNHLKWDFGIIYPNFLYINVNNNNFSMWDKVTDIKNVESYINDSTETYKKIFNIEELHKLIQIIKYGDIIKPSYDSKKILRESNYNYNYYSIKTQEELIEEFGENWIDLIEQEYMWNSDHMNYLFGKKLNISEDDIKNTNIIRYGKKYILIPNEPTLSGVQTIDQGNWFISVDLLTKKPIKPSYSPKKIVKESIEYDKIFVFEINNDEEFVSVQEYLINLGYKWGDGSIDILNNINSFDEYNSIVYYPVFIFVSKKFNLFFFRDLDNLEKNEFNDKDILLTIKSMGFKTDILDSNEVILYTVNDFNKLKLSLNPNYSPSYLPRKIIKESLSRGDGFIVEINSIDDLKIIQNKFPEHNINLDINRITTFPNWILIHDNCIYIWSYNVITPEEMLVELSKINLNWLHKQIFKINDLNLIKYYIKHGYLSKPNYKAKNIIKESYDYEYDEIVLRVKTEEDIDTLKKFLNKLGIKSTNTDIFKNYVLPNYLFLNILEFNESNFLQIVALSDIEVTQFLMDTCIYQDHRVNNYLYEIDELNDIKKILFKNSKLIPNYKSKKIIKESLNDKFYFVFKTEKELIDEFGENFRLELIINLRGEMDYLFGTKLDLNKTDGFKSYEDLDSHLNSMFNRILFYDNWCISLDMLKKVYYEIKPSYKPKNIIKESLKEFFYYVFKTEKELIDEFGENFREEIGMTSSGSMDYLLGTTFDLSKTYTYVFNSYKELEKHIENMNIIFYERWAISSQMLKRVNKPLTPLYNPRIIKR